MSLRLENCRFRTNRSRPGTMGAICGCLRAEGFEDYVNPNNPVYNNRVGLRRIVQNLGNYTSLFQRLQTHSLPSSVRGEASVTSPTSIDDSFFDMHHSPPRPLPYEADPRYYRLQRDGLISRREKVSGHSLEETEPLRSDSNADSESLISGDDTACGEGLDKYRSKSSLKLSVEKTSEVVLIYASTEEEDVCPTCLEEYTKENPKIMTKCSHNFHLGCIYEWMERSDSCPVCGKVMAFAETT